MSPQVSIIIVNYKTPELIISCVESVYQYASDMALEIIVVNNASKANDQEEVLAAHPTIRWIEMGYNAGFGRANNLGMRHARGQYILLLNSDTRLIDRSLQEALQVLKARPDVAAVGATQLNPDLTVKPEKHAFAPIFRYSWLIAPHPKVDAWLERVMPNQTYPEAEQVDYVPGSFFLISRQLATHTGGFDENLFLYAEDCEWSHRLSSYGKLLVLANCRYIHDEWGSSETRKEEATTRTYFNRFDRQAQVSNLYFIRKQKGSVWYLLLMLHYWLWVPLFYAIKWISQLAKGKPLEGSYDAQHKFRRTIGIFTRFFVPTLFLQNILYKVDKQLS